MLFSLFAAAGAFLVPSHPWVMWPHLIAVAWSVGTLALDWGCPLTPWEKQLTLRSGRDAYAEGFLQHYFLRAVSSGSNSRRDHVVTAVVLLLFNAAVYAFWVL